jgi:hypothetical protein
MRYTVAILALCLFLGCGECISRPVLSSARLGKRWEVARDVR